MVRARIVAIVCVGVLVSDCFGKEPKPTDLELVQGVWVEQSGEFRGKKTPGQSRLVFVDNTLKLLSKDGKRLWYVAKFKLDDVAAPREIAAEVTDTGPPDGKFEMEFPGHIEGIYAVDKDTLRICWGTSPRPAAFRSKDGSSHYYSVYKREPK
jgi:uncharacterized protein (TIGR03067 family)